MDGRHALESGGAAVACLLAAAGTFQYVAGTVDCAFVAGVGVCAALAASANYRARTGHSEQVADEAPTVETSPAEDAAETED